MSDERDDEPIGIDADAPEADWIEQHQPVIDDDDDLFPIDLPDDVPEADALDQARSVRDDDFAFADDPEPDEVSSEFDEDPNGIELDELDDRNDRKEPDERNEREVSQAVTPGRGCSPVGVLAEVLAHLLRQAADQISSRNPPRER